MREKLKLYYKREDVFPKRLRAAYTVEAAAVTGICMIFIGLLFMGGIKLYGSAMDTLVAYERNEVCPQDVFRLSQAAADIFGNEKTKEGD
mgnify:CR=1 FL=1